MIELVHLAKKYENAVPLRDVNGIINDGDIISVIGPSGTGKSTMLSCINMLEHPDGGQILLDGEDVTAKGYDLAKLHRRIGMVFQSFELFGHLTVIENVMMAQMDILGRTKQEAYDEGMLLLQRVGMGECALQYPDELSGGQQQRAAIARTLAMEPDVILFDEPTSALDPSMTGEVQDVIRDLAGDGRTMVIVSHDMSFARSICTRVFYMDQGGIYEEGTPEEIFDHPQKQLTRRFIHKLKVLEFNIENKNFDLGGAGGELDSYCQHNDIPTRIKYHIMLAIEELTMQIIFPRGNVYPVHISVEYAAEDERAIITISYSGDGFDPADTENRLAYDMLKQIAKDIQYSFDPDAELSNTVVVYI